MTLLSGAVSITGAPLLMLFIFAVAVFGYLLGRIEIKGVSLGTTGVFIAALLFGALFFADLNKSLTIGRGISYGAQAMKITENIGLVFFVTAVGFIAGPNFFKNLKKNFKSYILLGFVIILSGALTCVLCYFIGRGSEENPQMFVSVLDGLLSGALTSTPGFSAAKATVADVYAADAAMAQTMEDAVTVGYGIAYLFGVIGVVLFVQIIPKITKVDMNEERAKIVSVNLKTEKEYKGKLFNIDPIGLAAFSFAAVAGVFLGSVKIPLTSQGLSGPAFSLTITGGTLVASLILGHFGRIKRVVIMPNKKMLEFMRELGLALFLIGAGVPGGANFVKYFKVVYFFYGMAMTTVPLITGFLFAKYVLKLSILNNLGSITGGMTSTPALGTLINVSGTEDVASSYAATYPVALLAIVLVSQFLVVIFG